WTPPTRGTAGLTHWMSRWRTCGATCMVGRESELFRYTVKHSLIFASVIGIITLLQAYVFTGMLVS
ncbi:L-lactate permease, partial [Escherichia coli]|nr:L-lactate permease [Escherichia coli]